MHTVRLTSTSFALLATAVSAVVGCSDGSESSSSTSQAATATHAPDYSWWQVTENWGEALDSEQDEAVNDAFGVLSSTAGGYSADAAAAMNAIPAATNFGDAIRAAQSNLKDHLSLFAGQFGLVPSSVVPSAIMIVVGGKMTGELPTALGGGGQALIAFSLMPVKTTWKTADDPTVHHQWRFLLSASILANLSAGFGAGGNAGWIVGAGAIWGNLPSLDDMGGGLFGVSATGTLGPAGLTGDALLLHRGKDIPDPNTLNLDDGSTNIVGFAAWTLGATPEFAVHLSGGTLIDFDTILDQMGVSTDPSTGTHVILGPVHDDSSANPPAGAPAQGG